jgi:hypothetical protein
MPVDNNFYKIRGTELGEIKTTLQTIAKGNMPTQEEADDVLNYVQQAFQQPVDQDGPTSKVGV